MIAEIVRLSIKLRALVVGAAVVTLGLGLSHVPAASVDALPEFGPPLVEVQAEALGLSAQEVEQLITVPLEQDLLNGVPWLSRIRSESVPGLSTIDMVFDEGTDVLKARQMVQEHLTQAHALPQVGTPPVMIQPISSTGRVMMIGLGAKNLSLIDLSVLARWKIKPRLMGVPGVANVAIWGQRDRQLQVQVDPAELQQHHVSLDQVVSTTGNALWVSSLTFVEASTPGTGGFIDTSTQRFAVQHDLPITTAKDLAAVSVADTGTNHLRLGQVAKVVEDHQPLIGDAVLNGAPGLMLVIEKFPDADVEQVTKAVDKAMAEMAPGLSGVSIDTNVYRPASYLDSAMGNVATWAVIALILLVALLFGALLSWRAALVALLATTLPVVTAALVLLLLRIPFNALILAGLVAACAVVIDEAVTSIDALRRLQEERRDAGEPVPTASLVAEALADRRGTLLFATLAVLILPLPALALSGVAGAFARPLVLAYLLAVAAALVVALVVAPASIVVLVGRSRLERRTPAVLLRVQRLHDRLTRRAFRPAPLLGAFVVLALALLAVAPQAARGGSALPSLQDRDLLIRWQAAPGTSLPEMSRITAAAAAELRGLPAVSEVGSHVGRAVMADQSVGVDSAETWVRVKPRADYRQAVDDITRVVHAYPGLRAGVSTYTDDRIRAASAETGSSAPLVVRVYGYDYPQLQATAERIRGILAGVPGVVRPTVERMTEEPSVQVEVNLAAAQRYGIKPGDVRRASATYYAGLPVGSLYEDQKIFDVVVWGEPGARYTPAKVSDLLLDTPTGGHVRLGDVAKVTIGPSPTVITHDDISRSLDVTAQVSGDLGAVTDAVRARVDGIAMPSEFHLEVLGAQSAVGDTWRLIGFVLGALVAILLLLQAALASWRLAALVFLTTPLACAGGVLAAFAAGGVQGVGALAGLLGVAGLALRQNLLLVRALRDEAAEHGPLDPERVRAAANDRVVPVLLTAAATAVVALPLLALGPIAGTEVLFPLAVVLRGGLVSSVVLTLFVLPGLVLLLQRPRPRAPEPAPSAPSAV
ncbi:MAG: efflux RND transporter permease subunit [Amnibacterium sp.]